MRRGGKAEKSIGMWEEDGPGEHPSQPMAMLPPTDGKDVPEADRLPRSADCGHSGNRGVQDLGVSFACGQRCGHRGGCRVRQCLRPRLFIVVRVIRCVVPVVDASSETG